MSERSSTSNPVGAEASVGVAVEIDVDGRWGALSAIADWQAERRLDASVRVAGRPSGWWR